MRYSRTAFPRWRKQRSSSLNALHTPTRKAPALRATGAFFMRSGKLYFLSSSTGTVPTSRPSSSTTATFRSASVDASRAISRAMVCALEMASSSSLQSRPAGSISLWPFFTSKKYRDAFCLLLRARPQLFVAAQGWDRAGHATRGSLWPNHQSFDPQIVPTHRASGSNGNGT
jgi:hypothetical protein